MQTCKSKKIAWIYLNLRVRKLVKVRKTPEFIWFCVRPRTLEFIWFCVRQKNTWIHLILCESEKHLNSFDSVWQKNTWIHLILCETENLYREFISISSNKICLLPSFSKMTPPQLHLLKHFSQLLLHIPLPKGGMSCDLNFTINGLHYWLIHVYLCRF